MVCVSRCYLIQPECGLLISLVLQVNDKHGLYQIQKWSEHASYVYLMELCGVCKLYIVGRGEITMILSSLFQIPAFRFFVEQKPARLWRTCVASQFQHITLGGRNNSESIKLGHPLQPRYRCLLPLRTKSDSEIGRYFLIIPYYIL